MAITTDTGKLAVMRLTQVWEPPLPLSPGAIDQADRQQLLWGFPEILWGEPVVTVRVRGFAAAGRDPAAKYQATGRDTTSKFEGSGEGPP